MYAKYKFTKYMAEQISDLRKKFLVIHTNALEMKFCTRPKRQVIICVIQSEEKLFPLI